MTGQCLETAVLTDPAARVCACPVFLDLIRIQTLAV
jgi:hypothetical protein